MEIYYDANTARPIEEEKKNVLTTYLGSLPTSQEWLPATPSEAHNYTKELPESTAIGKQNRV